jgi:hypothetical protein
MCAESNPSSFETSDNLKRIVARVEELMRLCDALKAHQTRTLGAHVLGATHHHLLS